MNEIKKIEEDIHEMNVEEYYGEEELWLALERLEKLILSKLAASGRRFK